MLIWGPDPTPIDTIRLESEHKPTLRRSRECDDFDPIRKSSGPFCCDAQRSLLSIRSGSRLSSRELIGKLNHHSRGFDRGQGQKRFANMGRRQGVPWDLRSGRPSRAGSRPLRCEQGQSSILACQVRLGFRSARALQGNYLAMDKPRPDEEPNFIGFKSQEGDRGL